MNRIEELKKGLRKQYQQFVGLINREGQTEPELKQVKDKILEELVPLTGQTRRELMREAMKTSDRQIGTIYPPDFKGEFERE